MRMAPGHRRRRGRRTTPIGRAVLGVATIAAVAIGITVGATQAGSTPSKPAAAAQGGQPVRTQIDGGDGPNGTVIPLEQRPTLGDFHFTVRISCVFTCADAPVDGTASVELTKESDSSLVLEADAPPLVAVGSTAESHVDFFQLPGANEVPAGAYVIRAHFVADARNDHTETESWMQHVVFQPRPAQATTLTVDGPQYGSIMFSQAVPIQATVASGSGTPTGTVTAAITNDKDHSTLFTTPDISLTGADGKSATPKFDLDESYRDGNGGNDIPGGFYHVVFTYHPADGGFQTSTSEPFGLEIAKLNTKDWTLSPVPAQLRVGETATLTARYTDTVGGPGPTGDVQLMEGDGPSGGTDTPISEKAPVHKDGSGHYVAMLQVSFASPGVHEQVHADYSGDGNYNGGWAFDGNTSREIRVYDTAVQVTLTSATNPADLTQPVPLVATVTIPGHPDTPVTGRFTFDITSPKGTNEFEQDVTALKDGRLVVDNLNARSLGLGSSTITVRFDPSDTTLGGSQATITQVVTKAATTVTLASSNGHPRPGQSVTYTATVTGPGGKPTGSVAFRLDQGKAVDVAVKDGVASWTVSSLDAGSHVAYAEYSGDGTYAASTASAKLTVAAAATPPTHPSTPPAGRPSSTSAPAHADGGTHSGGGGLAFTGSPAAQLAIWATVLLAAGAGLTFVGARRRRRAGRHGA